MDIRGYGRSTRPPEMAQPPEANPPLVPPATWRWPISAAVNGFIRQKRGLPRIVHMGWSWGSALTGRFAADNPGRGRARGAVRAGMAAPDGAERRAGSPPSWAPIAG